MHGLSKPIALLSLIIIAALALTACSGGDEETETGDPTPELAVVVFATEDPNAADLTPTVIVPLPTTSPTPAPAATAGMGISQGNQQQSDDVQLSTNVEFNPENRPPNVNPLTGLKVDDPALLKRRPLMVRVGNDPAARPQVALNNADIVYEEIVEWWVTRFTAIYLSQDPETIAPIRSARLINLQLTPQYQGALANSGGSDGVRWQLSQTDIINLDEFFVPGPYFYRPNEGWQTRLAFDATAAREYLEDEDLESNVNLRGFYFSDLPDLATLPPEVAASGIIGEATGVVVPYPGRSSDTRWQYDADSGKYLRSIAGEPSLDFDKNQIAASNVVIYFADHQATDIVEDSNGATSIRIIVNGHGPAWLIRDGKIAKGNWQTNGKETPSFTFNDGQPMPLKPGNTWVQVVPLEYQIEIDGTGQGVEGIEETVAPAKTEPPAEGTDDKPTAVPSPTLTPIGARSTATPVNN